MPNITQSRGFNLIEMLIVLAILSILVVMAMPSGEGKLNRARIQETLKLSEQYKSNIEGYFRLTGEFPSSNEEAGMPNPQQILGNFLTGLDLVDGAMHLQLGNKINQKLDGQVISIRPIFVPGVKNAPISWVCGYNTIPADMVVAGENLTSVDNVHLPLECR